MRETLISKISNGLIDSIKSFSSKEKGIFQNLAKEIKSPILSMALIKNMISPEISLNFILAEEKFQLRKWPKLRHIHTAREEEILFNIYYHLFLNSLGDGAKNALS
jgi:hypothetical protein